jgi:hypothetical protein
MNKFEPFTTTPPPRYHITDTLWDSFTIEGVNKTMDALCKRGELRHPEDFTVRVSAQALWKTAPDIFEPESEILEDTTYSFSNLANEKSQWFFDFHYYGYKNGSVSGGSYFITQTIKLSRPEIPLQQRDLYLSAKKKSMQEGLKLQSDVPIRGWWEKDYACIEYALSDTLSDFWDETNFPELVAAVLIICLHERTVQRVIVEPRKPPKSRIAKKLAARRSNSEQETPETVLYVPARFYKPGGGTSTHAPKHLHYRNPHWRRQPYGPRSNPSYMDVWIEGMFINDADCTEAEKAEVKIRTRNFKLLG